jgi:hypothetical protein
MIDAIMIQSALQGMQQDKIANFGTKIGERQHMGWWWKSYIADTYCMEVMVYLSKESPIGFMLAIDYLDEEAVEIFNKPLATFEEFQEIFTNKKFLATAFRDWKKAKK